MATTRTQPSKLQLPSRTSLATYRTLLPRHTPNIAQTELPLTSHRPVPSHDCNLRGTTTKMNGPPEETTQDPATGNGQQETNRPPLTALLAISEDGIIGNQGDLPWRLSSDLQRFKRITMGGVLIMGRKTYDSIGRPLPGRTTIVVTRDPEWTREGVLVASSPSEAIRIAGNQKTFVVGGAEIYRQMLPSCDQVLLTRVLAPVTGDTRIDLNLSDFEITDRTKHPPSERDEYATEYIEYCRKKRS